MSREKVLHGFAGVISGPILDHDDVLVGLREYIEQKRRIAFRVEPSRLGFVEKLPRELVNEAKDLVTFAFAAGGHLRLLASERPGVAQ